MKKFKKIVLGAVVLAALVCVLALVLSKTTLFQSKTTKIGFEDIGELATQSAYCTEVEVTTKDSKEWLGVSLPFTQSKYIYSYDVEVKAGYDFGQITWSVDKAASTILVKLPAAKILSTEVDADSFQVYHESQSIFTPITTTDNNEAMANLKQNAETDAVSRGLLDNARANAETLLKTFFANAYDLNQYQIVFSDK